MNVTILKHMLSKYIYFFAFISFIGTQSVAPCRKKLKKEVQILQLEKTMLTHVIMVIQQQHQHALIHQQQHTNIQQQQQQRKTLI